VREVDAAVAEVERPLLRLEWSVSSRVLLRNRKQDSRPRFADPINPACCHVAWRWCGVI